MPTIRNLEDKDELLPVNSHTFISYPYLIAIMSVLQVMTVIYGLKMFLLFGFDVSIGWALLMPIMFFLFQIVSEVNYNTHPNQNATSGLKYYSSIILIL